VVLIAAVGSGVGSHGYYAAVRLAVRNPIVILVFHQDDSHLRGVCMRLTSLALVFSPAWPRVIKCCPNLIWSGYHPALTACSVRVPLLTPPAMSVSAASSGTHAYPKLFANNRTDRHSGQASFDYLTDPRVNAA
jgi:hypothetical protein